MVKERVYNDIYPPDIVPISRSTSPRFGPYFPKTFHATQKQPAKIGCSAKVLAFAWTVIHPLLSRVWGRKRAYSFRWFSLLHRSRWDSTTPFPPENNPAAITGNYSCTEKPNLSVLSVELTRDRPRVAWTSKSHLECGGRAIGVRYNRGG